MRIVLLTYEFRPWIGGIGTCVAEVAGALARRGHTVSVFAPDYRGVVSERDRGTGPVGDRGAVPEGDGAVVPAGDREIVPEADSSGPGTVLRFRSGRNPGSPLDLLRNARWLRRRIRETAPDWIVLADLHAEILAGVALRLGGGNLPAMAALLHGSELHHLRAGRKARVFGRPALRRCAVTLPNSEFTRSRFEQSAFCAADAPSVIIGAGVARPFLETPSDPARQEALRRRLQLGPEAIVILTVARLVRRKGIDLCLQTLASLDEPERSRIVYVVAGEGPERTYLENLASSLGLTAQFQLLGRVDDDDLLHLHDLATVYLQWSREVDGDVEGFGVTFLEAAARGRPSLGFDHGGVSDTVVNGETGLLVPEGDLEEGRRQLQALLRDAGLRRRLGDAGRERALHGYSWEAVADRVERALQENLHP